MKITPLFPALFLAGLAAPALSVAATATWTQTGASSSTNAGTPDDNMNWLVAANWSGSALPAAGDDIVFGNVTADTSAISGVNGRSVSFLNTDFLGASTGSLSLTQSSAFTNNLVVQHNSSGAASLQFRVGAVSISNSSSFSYTAQQTNLVSQAVWTRQLTLGYGANTVSNAGTLAASFAGNGGNRFIFGFMSIADGSTFTNSGTFSLNANSTNSGVQGGTQLNALIGATTNTGAITITRNGSSMDASDLYGAARGGIEFASLNNSGAASTFSFTANNASLLSTTAPSPAIADHAAVLVVAGALQNDGTFTLNRTPLKSKVGVNGSSDTDASDSVSRTLTAQFGSLANSATGAFVVNHTNNATPLDTTASTLEITSTGAATNAGWISLKGTATSTNGADGAILTRLVTQGGFSNSSGGILLIDGKAVLANTGAFSNANTQSSRVIQGTSRAWNTLGLRIESTTAANASFTWATGTNINTSTFSAGTFSADNFTVGDLILSTGSFAYTLAGGGDLLIAGNFHLTGTLNLGDWSAITTTGGQGQSLFFANTALESYIGSLISSGAITATVANGYSLATFASSGNDAFYIGVTASAVPEPSSYALLTGLIAAGCLTVRTVRRSPRPPR